MKKKIIIAISAIAVLLVIYFAFGKSEKDKTGSPVYKGIERII